MPCWLLRLTSDYRPSGPSLVMVFLIPLPGTCKMILPNQSSRTSNLSASTTQEAIQDVTTTISDADRLLILQDSVFGVSAGTLQLAWPAHSIAVT